MQPISVSIPQPIIIPAHPVSGTASKTPQENKSKVFKSIDQSGKTDKTKNYRHNHKDGGTVDEYA